MFHRVVVEKETSYSRFQNVIILSLFVYERRLGKLDSLYFDLNVLSEVCPPQKLNASCISKFVILFEISVQFLRSF